MKQFHTREQDPLPTYLIYEQAGDARRGATSRRM